jgi:pimeloyl-ACP methyl ester carboxylesterase
MGGYLMGELVALGARPQWIGMFHSKFKSDTEQKKAQRARAIDLVVENKNLYMRTMISNLFSDAFRVKKYHVIDQLVEEAFLIQAETVQHCQRAMMNRVNHLNSVEALQIPVHYFAGDLDQSVPLEDILEESQKLSFSTLQIIENVGHMGQWECTEDSVHWIRQCIA